MIKSETLSAIPIRMPGTEQTFNGHYPCLNYLSLPPNPIRNAATALAYKFNQQYFQNCYTCERETRRIFAKPRLQITD